MSAYAHDVFVSCCDVDRPWVQSELLPRLEQAGLAVLTESDFEVGVSKLINRERAIDGSRHTLIVLTPEWIQDEWASFEGLLVQTEDPAGRRGRMIPLVLRPCEPPKRIAMLESADLVDTTARDAEMTRLLRALVKKSRLFVSYRSKVEPDQGLADFMHEFLTDHGQDVFVDTALRTGDAWLERIDENIKESDFVIVLLSEQSANSEMLKAEVRRAYEYRKLNEHPLSLPVRVSYEGLLPYSIDAFLDPLQYIVWESEADNQRVGQEILAAIHGHLPQREPFQVESTDEEPEASEDGELVTADTLSSPLPEVDQRFLDELVAPGGTVKLRSKFYIERKDDARLKRQIVSPGTITTIRAARQTGKSSLLVRGIQHARQHGAQVVNIDLQRVDRDDLESSDRLLRYLAECIVRKLRLSTDEVARMWDSSIGAQDKITYLIEDYVLPESNGLVVLAMDEVDRLLSTPFHSDFFGLVRSWHNAAAYDDLWNKLTIVMVISTEPFLLISDVNQSPFNVGLKLYLEDFDRTQVKELNRRHGSPLKETELGRFEEWIHGHPYLTRKALYTMVTESLPWDELERIAPTDQGPFADHLRRYHWMLRQEPELGEALKEVIREKRCSDEMVLFRLLRAGLVKGSGDVCRCRCALYSRYFEEKL